MSSLPFPRRLVKPCVCDSHVLYHPICPCELRPGGIPGVLSINGIYYSVEVIGELPKAGEPVIDGYRLTNPDGICHDVCIVAGRWECTCGDWQFRRSCQTEAKLADCKHTLACRRHFALPRDSHCPDLSPDDVFALTDGEARMLAGPEVEFCDP